METRYKIIKTKKELRKLIKHCKNTGYASIDFETSGHPFHSPLGYPTILGVSFQPGSSWIIPLGHFDSVFKNDFISILNIFSKAVLMDPNIIKVAFNAKFEMKWLKKYNLEMVGRVFDPMLGKYLLDEERPMDLKSLTARFLPEFAGYEDYEGSKLPWDKKPLEGLSKYCGIDTDASLRLMLFFEHRLMRTGLYPLFRNMLMMGTRVLADSEFMGMPIDTDYLTKLVKDYQIRIQESEDLLRSNKKIKKFNNWQTKSRISKMIMKVETEIEALEEDIQNLKVEKKSTTKAKEVKKLLSAIERKEKSIKTREAKIDRYIAGQLETKSELKALEPINFSSPNQMIDFLFISPNGLKFEIVKYTIDKKTKNETNRPSTDEEVLLELQKVDKSGFVEQLLKHRALTKLYSTYVIGMYNKLSVEGRIHGRFLLHGTVTGRLSSRDPNLQNIPRDTTSSDIKKMFIPPPGKLFFQLDYSQAELRVMAAMAKEETMIQWFKDGKDIHLTTALKKEREEHRYDEIKALLKTEDGSDEYIYWKKKRKAAKTINFGIIYGQGAPKLAEALGWSVDEAKQFLKEYFELFPNVKKFIQKQHRQVRRHAYVKNLFGRRRRLYDIDSDQKWLVAQAERQSVNAPIQGAASDYALFSSIIIWEQIRAGIIPIDMPQAGTVHDSLEFFVDPDKVHQVVKQLEAITSNPQTMEWFGFQIDDVVMKVDFEVSHENWGKLKTYDPNTDYTQYFS